MLWYELFTLLLPICMTVAWMTHPYVQRDLYASLAPREPSSGSPVNQALGSGKTLTIRRPDGTKLIKVALTDSFKLDANLAGSVRNSVEPPPRQNVPKPRPTLTVDGSDDCSNSNKAKRKDLWRFLSLKAIMAILKFSALQANCTIIW